MKKALWIILLIIVLAIFGYIFRPTSEEVATEPEAEVREEVTTVPWAIEEEILTGEVLTDNLTGDGEVLWE